MTCNVLLRDNGFESCSFCGSAVSSVVPALLGSHSYLGLSVPAPDLKLHSLFFCFGPFCGCIFHWCSRLQLSRHRKNERFSSLLSAYRVLHKCKNGCFCLHQHVPFLLCLQAAGIKETYFGFDEDRASVDSEGSSRVSVVSPDDDAFDEVSALALRKCY